MEKLNRSNRLRGRGGGPPPSPWRAQSNQLPGRPVGPKGGGLPSGSTGEGCHLLSGKKGGPPPKRGAPQFA